MTSIGNAHSSTNPLFVASGYSWNPEQKTRETVDQLEIGYAGQVFGPQRRIVRIRVVDRHYIDKLHVPIAGGLN